MDEETGATPAEQDKRIDAAVMGWLLNEDVRGPVSVDEVAREIGDRVAVTDSLARLEGAGLVHRMGEFVFATHAARRFADLCD
jgi:predicted transcriptional regulator